MSLPRPPARPSRGHPAHPVHHRRVISSHGPALPLDGLAEWEDRGPSQDAGRSPIAQRVLQLFAITFFSTGFSKDKSAYIHLKRLPSRSNSFSCFIFDASRPHCTWPSSCNTSRANPALSPDLVDRLASASCKVATICVSLNVDWGRRTFWIGVAIVPQCSHFMLSQIGGKLTWRSPSKRFFRKPDLFHTLLLPLEGGGYA